MKKKYLCVYDIKNMDGSEGRGIGSCEVKRPKRGKFTIEYIRQIEKYLKAEIKSEGIVVINMIPID